MTEEQKTKFLQVSPWAYLQRRLKFRLRCCIKNHDYIEKNGKNSWFLYCSTHRAVLTRYRNGKVYESSFCDKKKCTFRGTCDNCYQNLNKNVK